MNHLATAIALVLLSGCTVSKFQNRTIKDSNGTEKVYSFAYGKFCRPGYPDTSNGLRLDSLWPPADDLDAACYAHDQCYTLTHGDNDLCDGSFRKVLINNQSKLTANGCWNLATDMTIVFFGENYSVGNNASETAATQVAHTTVGLPFATFFAIFKAPIRPFLSEPIEGTCNRGEVTSPHEIVKSFENVYESSILNNENKALLIPTPSAN